MEQLLKNCAIFAHVDVNNSSARVSIQVGTRHRGEQTDFYPSENLENSKMPR